MYIRVRTPSFLKEKPRFIHTDTVIDIFDLKEPDFKRLRSNSEIYWYHWERHGILHHATDVTGAMARFS
jgi:hypothetical protein